MSGVKPHLILREKWFRALESGNHKQCQGSLEHCGEVCALGLARQVANMESWAYKDIAEAYGIKYNRWWTVIHWNDSRYLSFKQIADNLRKNVCEIFED